MDKTAEEILEEIEDTCRVFSKDVVDKTCKRAIRQMNKWPAALIDPTDKFPSTFRVFDILSVELQSNYYCDINPMLEDAVENLLWGEYKELPYQERFFVEYSECSYNDCLDDGQILKLLREHFMELINEHWASTKKIQNFEEKKIMVKFQKYRLKEVASIIISNVDKKSKEGESQVQLCNFTDVYYNWAITSELATNFMIATAPANQIKKFALHKGQVAITKDSETRHDIGIPCLIAADFQNVILGYHCALITPDPAKLDGLYLNAYLNSTMAKEYFANNATGSGMRYTLSTTTIEDFIIYLPNIEEQRRVGKIFSDIDRKIALNREINRNLEAMARQLYDYWFVQFDFSGEHGKPYKSSGGKMVWNERLRREIPDNWVVENLSDAAEIYNGATPSTAVESNYGGDIVWITPKDLSEQQCKFVYHGARNISQQGYDSCSTHMLPTHSLLMSSRAPIGLLSISEVPLCTNQGFKSFVPKDGYDVFYIFYYIRQQLPKIEQLGTGTTFKEVSREDLMRFPILKIPQGLQREWLSRVESMAERQFKSVLETDKLKKQRDELLPLLINGQVSVMPTKVNCDLSHD